MVEDRWVCARCFTSAGSSLTMCPNCGTPRPQGDPAESSVASSAPPVVQPASVLAVPPVPPAPTGPWDAAIPAAASSPFRSAGTRAKVALGFLVAIAVVEGIWGLWELVGLSFTDAFLSPENASDDEITVLIAWAGFGIWLGIGQVVTLIGSGLSFVAWQSRTVDNIPALGLGTPVQTPRWSIGWWFVPIANLFKPYESVLDLARRMAPTGVDRRGLVLSWWLLFIGYDVVSTIYGYVPAETADEWVLSGAVGIASSLLGIVAAFLGIRVIRAVQRDADVVAAAQPPSLPSVAAAF